MNISEKSVNQATTITMDLENLQKKYSNVLIQYRQAVSNYISFLNSQQQEKNLITIEGQSFIGKGTAGQSTATTLQECQAQCTNNPKCTGATFISNQCELKTGDGPLVPESNSIAIVPKSKQLLLNINDLNQKLIRINKQIIDKINLSKPIYLTTEKETLNQSQKLQLEYKNLLSERDNIETLLNDYETLNRTEDNNQIKINQNYYFYILLCIFIILAIIVLIKLNTHSIPQPIPSIEYNTQLGINAYLIVFLIICIIVAIYFWKKYVTL
jgi:NADH:ubiquinone oxidoreductase subunit 3 (subunit A)